jgi:hypothetical protein
MADSRSSNRTIDPSELAVKIAHVLDTLENDRAYDLLLVKRSDEWMLVAKTTTSEQGADGQVRTWRIKAAVA